MTKNSFFTLKLKCTGKIWYFVSRGNQDGITKSNTTPQLAEIIVTDRNSKEHQKNKVNQREMLKEDVCFCWQEVPF